MSWISDLWDWLFHRHHPKNTLIVPRMAATRFTGTAPAVKRSNNVIAFRQPGTGAVIWAPQPAQVTRADHRTPVTGAAFIWGNMGTLSRSVLATVMPNTTAMNISGSMPHQTLQVQSPPEGQVAIASDPPTLK